MGLNQEDQDFATAFNEGAAIDGGTVTEDMASPGMDLGEAVEEQDEANGAVDPNEAQEGEVAPPAEGAAAEAGVDAGADGAAGAEGGEEPAPGADAAATGDSDIEKERQRLKSWEGRLKAREAELKAKEQSSGDDAGADPAQAVQEAAAAVEDHKPIDQVLSRLAEDFGQDFVDGLSALIDARASEIADKVAGEKVGEVAGTVDKIISGLTDERARTHFETIAEAHPDFMQIHDSKEFKDWIDSLGDRADEARSIVESGSARQINKLLSEYKDAAKTGEESHVDEAAMSAAQSVKGRAGMRLPDKPAASDDYEAAWNSMT